MGLSPRSPKHGSVLGYVSSVCTSQVAVPLCHCIVILSEGLMQKWTLWPLRSLGRSEGGGSEVKVLFPWLLPFILHILDTQHDLISEIIEGLYWERMKKTEVKPQWRDHCNMHTLGTNKHTGGIHSGRTRVLNLFPMPGFIPQCWEHTEHIFSNKIKLIK